jgi:cytoskeletal protein RodZ
MRIVLMLFLMMMLAACGAVAPTDTSAPGDVATTAPTAVATTQTPTEETSPPTAEPAPTDAPDVELPDSDTAVPPIVAATTVAQASAVRPQDWTLGAADPEVVIIEYGDFQ